MRLSRREGVMFIGGGVMFIRGCVMFIRGGVMFIRGTEMSIGRTLISAGRTPTPIPDLDCTGARVPEAGSTRLG